MAYSILDKVDHPSVVKSLDHDELGRLAEEIRDLIINTTSKTGGHLASSLGVVELTIALYRALNPPTDRILWDVGHQAYAHKILTGRKEDFGSLRTYGGISGFPKREESEYDVVDSGHSGSSISYGFGLALARDLKDEDYTIAVVIGDGSMTSGVAFEAINQAGHHLESNLIIVLNDNEMSISENIGGCSSYLSRIRIKPGYTHLKESLEGVLKGFPAVGDEMVKLMRHVKEMIGHALLPGTLFEDLGLKYVGPIDGHDIEIVEETVREARDIEGPVLIHVLTRKGKGYRHSEKSPDRFHGVPAFTRSEGTLRKKKGATSYTKIFGDGMIELAGEIPETVAITAAMKLGTGLDEFSRLFPDRFIDVGIAEQLGVNLAAGLALGGLRPVVAIYSTFLQRSFDQISHEVCLQNLPVLFAVDRAGLVGEDGETHHGYFDLAYLRILPNMTVMAPGDGDELYEMLKFAMTVEGPVAIRFPRGEAVFLDEVGKEPLRPGFGEVVSWGDDVAIFAIGDMVEGSLLVARLLEERGISAAVVNSRFAKPIDEGFICDVVGGKKLAVTVEDGVRKGGFGGAVSEILTGKDLEVPLMTFGLPDRYVEHGKIEELRREVGLDPTEIADGIESRLGSMP